MKQLQFKWFYRLGILLLLFLTMFVFMKLSPIWSPILSNIFTIFMPFILSLFITFLLHPIVEKLQALEIPRTVAILIIYFLFFGLLGFGVYKGVPVFMNQLKDLAENTSNIFSVYEDFTKNIHNHTESLPDGIHQRIEEGIAGLEQKLNMLISNIIGFLQGLINSIVLMTIIPFIVFYMLKDIKRLKNAAWYITPSKWRNSLESFFRDANESLGNYLRGQLFVCVLIGTLATISFWIIQMKYPLLLGMLIGITNVIPYFGPIIGLIPTALIAATVSVKMLIFVIAIVFILQFIEGNILSPLIVGKSLHLHPLLIIFALLAGGELGGVVGLIFAVPILSVIKVLIIHIKKHFSPKWAAKKY